MQSPWECDMCCLSRRATCLEALIMGYCSAITILKLLLILNKGALHFHFALSLQITVVCPDHKF